MHSGQGSAFLASAALSTCATMKFPASVIERALTDSAVGALPQETEAEVQMQLKSDAQEKVQHLMQALATITSGSIERRRSSSSDSTPVEFNFRCPGDAVDDVS
jgi:hypothetical protein